MTELICIVPDAASRTGTGRVQANPEAISVQLENTMQRFAGMVRGLGRRSGLDDAELDELAQAVRVRLWRALCRGEKAPTITSSYVHRTAQTATIDIIRARRARRHTPEDPASLLQRIPGTERPPDIRLEEAEGARRILQVIDQLPPDRRTAVKLHLAGYGREEIAPMLDWTGPRTRNLIYRGLEQLRQRLTLLGLGPGMGDHRRRA